MRILTAFLAVLIAACGNADSKEMTSKRTEVYRVTSQEAPGLTQELNFILSRISDRLDKVEGIRSQSNIALSRLIRTEGSISGTGTYTIIIPAGVTLDLGTVETGDKIFMQFHFTGTKGGTAGDILTSIVAFGSSQLDNGVNATYAHYLPNVQPADSIIADTFFVYATVTTGGTLQLNTQGFSQGSDIAGASFGLKATVFRNS